MTQIVDKKIMAVHQRFDRDFPYFAKHMLKIKTKEGGELYPFNLNRAQWHIHNEIETQKRATGKVRVLILKGRQQGCSTYIGGRFYHQAIRKKGQSVFILSHQAETTKKLFAIVNRYYEHTPASARPPCKIANRREFHFESIGSEYSVGTAGSKEVGRGGTVQLFHGSEVGFWENTSGIRKGILQSVPNLPNTEIVLESTANGMGNMFYEMCMEALAKTSDYIVIFTPWFWQDEYTLSEPHDGILQLSDGKDSMPNVPEDQQDNEIEYQRLYDLTPQQMWWRRAKITEFSSVWEFKQEYPAHIMEAFQTSGAPLIHPNRIMLARKSTLRDLYAPLILGVDPGRNRDRTVFNWRRGREMLEPEIFRFKHEDMPQMQIAGMIADRIDNREPDMVFMDLGHGYGVYDRLRELGYARDITGVLFGSEALEPTLYLNKRAEMWCMARDWFHGEDGEVSIPDSDDIQKDFACMPGIRRTSSQKIQLESKEKIKQSLGMSPDIADAFVLTFAFPVSKKNATRRRRQQSRSSVKSGKHELITLQRMRLPHTMQRRHARIK